MLIPIVWVGLVSMNVVVATGLPSLLYEEMEPKELAAKIATIFVCVFVGLFVTGMFACIYKFFWQAFEGAYK